MAGEDPARGGLRVFGHLKMLGGNLLQKSPAAISLIGRIGEALRLQAQSRYAGGSQASRIPRYAPRPAVSIPARRRR